MDKERTESDLIGELKIYDTHYFGIQTVRALSNFPITGIRPHHFPNLVYSLAFVKKAAATANVQIGDLQDHLGQAIGFACDEIIQGKYHDQFLVDMIQGGAGTSTNMNANEVIANIALEYLGYPKGAYHILHPNDHVNLSQSTNDVYPTAARIAILLSYGNLIREMKKLFDTLKAKAEEFSCIYKVGRTQLQDAVPMSLGQEFMAFAVTIEEDIFLIDKMANYFREINLGGTAIGTGLNASKNYASKAIDHLANISGLSLHQAPDLIEATVDMGAFVIFSSALKRYAVKLSKICNDLRLLSSGPRAGFFEIILPAVQPGSSIMPGKINPVIPEAVNQVAYQVIGNDLAVTLASEAGQLQLNAMEPLIIFNILSSLSILEQATRVLSEKCIIGIEANQARCQMMLEQSLGLATVLNRTLGYEKASKVAKIAMQTGKTVREIILEEGFVAEDVLERLLDPLNMLHPQ